MEVFLLLKKIYICLLIVQLFHGYCVQAVTTSKPDDVCDGGFDPFSQEDKRSMFYSATTTINDRYLRPGWYGLKGFQIATNPPEFAHCGTRYPIYQQGKLNRQNANIQSIKMCARKLDGTCSATWNIDAKICSSKLTIFNLKRSPLGRSAYCLEKTSGEKFPDFQTIPQVRVILENYDNQSQQYRYFCDFNPKPETELKVQAIWYVGGMEIKKSDFVLYDNDTERSITDDDLRDSGINTVGFTISCGIRASYSNESEAGFESKSSGRFVGITVGRSLYFPFLFPREPDIPVINEGEVSNISIRLTDPIGHVFNDTELGLTLQTPEASSPCDMSVASDSHCGIELDPTKPWYTYYTIKVKGEITERYGKDTQVFRLYLKTAPVYEEHLIWGNYSLSFEVYVKKDTSNLENRGCQLYSDPRLVTFKGLGEYSMQLDGIFTMYKSGNYLIEVQVQTFRCDIDGNAYCVCGVVVRVGKTAFMINLCHIGNRFDVPEFIDYPVCGDGPDVMQVTKLYDNQYTVKLPNQATVRIYIGRERQTTSGESELFKWLNVYIYPSVLDVGVTRGLCGNLTDTDKEEKVLRNGTTTTNNDTFFMSWRVKDEQNLFDTDYLDNLESLRSAVSELTYQTCKCTAPSNQRTSINHIDCQQTNNNNCTEDPGRLVNSKRCRSLTRKRRSLPSYFLGNSYPRRVRRNTGARNGWTDIKTREYCQGFFNSSDIVKQCKDIPGVDLATALNSCIDDIQLTGSDMFALSTLDTLRSKCLYEATMNLTLQEETPEKPSVLQLVKEVACPAECSNNGQCKNGICVCKNGFIGSDCSIAANYIPVAIKLDDDGYCDNCKEIAVFGGTFIESDDFKCQLEVIKVDNNKVLYTKSKIEVRGVVESIAEVTCPLPRSARTKRSSDEVPVIDETVTGYKISVSNTGQLYSKQLTMVIINSQCVSCNIIGEDVNCAISKEYCYTDNRCYRNGESNVLNSEYVCNSQNQEWFLRKKNTPKPSNTEGIPSEIIIGITVGGVLLLAIIVVVVITCVKRAGRKSVSK